MSSARARSRSCRIRSTRSRRRAVARQHWPQAGDVRHLLSNLSRTSAIPVLSALRGMHRGYVEADRLMGSMCITGPIQLQMPVVERACEVSRGTDRAEMLWFACQFMEFGGWLFQDAVIWHARCTGQIERSIML